MASTGTGPKIVVLGSLNMDLVARCRALPAAGETLTASSFAEMHGGKGANQAVAARRAGGQVTMIGRVGDDGYADRLTTSLLGEGIDCDSVQRTPDLSSGLAMIVVAESGENQIVVVPGANGCVTCEDVDRFAELIRDGDVLLLQLEVPVEAAVRAAEVARSAGTRVIFDPAPAPESLPDALFPVDLICPNETEAAALTGQQTDSPDGVEAAARILHRRGAGAVVVTCGDRGAVLFDGITCSGIEVFPVAGVDATAAGDAFAGAVAVRWAETDSLADAVRWGSAAGAIAATRPGAQPSLPTRAEIAQLSDR